MTPAAGVPDDQGGRSTTSGLVSTRRRWLAGLGATAAVIAVLVPGFVFGPKLLGGTAGPDPTDSTAAGTSTGQPATDGSAPATGPASSSPSAGVDPTRAMLAGQRKILLHLVEIDRDLSLPFDGEVHVGDGTGPDALFVLEPVGVDYMIKSLNPDVAHQPCLGVKLDSEGYAFLVGAECYPTGATMFGLARQGKDDKGRTSYSIHNEKYGVVEWSPSRKKIYVEHLGDAPVGTTFSMVDRGAV